MLIPLVVAATLSCDVAVVGGGSAGFAAALAAAESGSSTILIEKEDALGGTSTICGVNNWEPVCGATGTPRRVYERLAAIPGACGIWYQKYHSSFGDAFPGAFLEIDDKLTYEDTLRRYGPSMAEDRADWLARYHGIVFEPDKLDGVMRQMLAETGRCRVFTSVAYSSCLVGEGKIKELSLSNGKVICPKVVIDTCGYVAKDAGCASEMSDNPNSVTLLFRISSDPAAPEVPVPEDIPDNCWWAASFPVVFCVQYPNGDRNVNMLPTMTGSEAVQLGSEAAYAECLRRVFAQWKWMKRTYPQHFGEFKITKVFSRLGYRETHRIVCEHMLTGSEVKNGAHFDDEIATADHAFDSHGASTAYSGELSQPYGIPLRSLKPLGVCNLYVAGRIAGFDRAAASSCRLSRTMMQLGEAAGKAAAKDAAGMLRPVDVRVDGTNAVITVAEGVANEESVLYLAYGPSDEGLMIADWPNKILVAEGLSSQGGTYEVAIPGRGECPSLRLRAFVASGAMGLKTDNRAYIDLKETPVPGRRYEIRFVGLDYNTMIFLFGGVGRVGGAATSMFQVYSGDGAWHAGSQSDAANGTCRLFDVQAQQAWDVRIDYGENTQDYYYKAAELAEYTKAGATAINHAAAGYKGDLYLFARNDGGAKFSQFPYDDAITIFRYKVTEISTGQVLKNLMPGMDGQGHYEMVDTITGDSYPNAGSGAFSSDYDLTTGASASQLAGYEGVRIEMAGPRKLKVSVDPGISNDGLSLLLCWGSSDEGTSAGVWENSVSLCDMVPVEGIVTNVLLRSLGVKPNDVARALLLPVDTYHHVDACRSGGGLIDLGYTTGGSRQYDLRCKFNSVQNALFGGLNQNKTAILQIYGDQGKYRIWFGDNVAHDYFTPEVNNDTYYDLRIVLYDGDQRAYVKKATENEYVLMASASVLKIPQGLHLALLGRFQEDAPQLTCNGGYFNHYQETDLETGKVLHELVPVRYGENDAKIGIYDIAQGQLCDCVSGTLASSLVVLQELNGYGEVTDISSLCRMPEIKQGLKFIVR